jgi:hypothetical protein
VEKYTQKHNRIIQDQQRSYQVKLPFVEAILLTSVAEPHNFYAAPAPGKNFDAAPAAPAPALLYSKAKFLKRTKV